MNSHDLNLKVGVFCYNFPHKKTQDFLLRLFLDSIKVDSIFAADWIELNIPGSSIRSKIRHGALVHPQQIAQKIGADYYVLPHNSPELTEIARKKQLDLGVITGARILERQIIASFNIGILNFHPGLIPDARGLDSMLWSLYNGIPLGVTAHLIDQRVDAGRIVLKEKIPVYEDDTLLDLNERLQEKQLEMLLPAIKNTVEKKWSEINGSYAYNRKMPPELEQQVVNRLAEYLNQDKEYKA